jgi:hypothetical protein
MPSLEVPVMAVALAKLTKEEIQELAGQKLKKQVGMLLWFSKPKIRRAGVWRHEG